MEVQSIFDNMFHFSLFSSDPDLSPTKTIQNVHTMDNARWPQQPQGRFDTTYRTEYVNRLQHPVNQSFELLCFSRQL